MSSSSEDNNGVGVGGGGGGGDGDDEVIVLLGAGGGQGREFGEPSSSRQRFINEVWPEPFVESLAYQVAIDASHSSGRLSAAPAIANVFQVCSTWRAISRSDYLWQNLTRQIWGRDRLIQETWRDEYMQRHHTAYNFRARRAVYTRLEFDVSGSEESDSLICRCLALSDVHLACGFVDGSVRLFDLTTRLHIRTFNPHQRDRLGHFSQAVSGIVLTDSKLVFASVDGDIHVALIHEEGPRRVQFGNVVNDGTLVDFTGSSQWWVGLFAGVPGRAFHVWNGQTEELVFVGGMLTDPEAVMGWHLLTELTDSIGRVRMTSQESAVACTSVRAMVFDLRNQVIVFDEERDVIVDSVDVNNDLLLMVNIRRYARVHRVDNFVEMCRFRSRGGGGRLLGCINGGYVFICTNGVMRAWDVENGGVYLGSLRDRIGDGVALVADDRHVAASSRNGGLHLWDFGAL